MIELSKFFNQTLQVVGAQNLFITDKDGLNIISGNSNNITNRIIVTYQIELKARAWE